MKPPESPCTRNSTCHVLVLMTDGNTNMGGSPVPVVGQIRELLSIGRDVRNPREDYLDIYVFGIGAMVNSENIAELASKKSGEKHVFHMQDIKDLQKAFHEMIDESETLSMCGLGWAHEEANDHQRNPWHVSIKIARPGKGLESCKGALISEYFVLTAAHCFDIDDQAHWITVDVGKSSSASRVENLWSHPQYNIGKLRGAGIPEFYDYDVALLKLKDKIKFSFNARPICLPCTEGTTRALRKPHPETTCNDHSKSPCPLLPTHGPPQLHWCPSLPARGPLPPQLCRCLPLLTRSPPGPPVPPAPDPQRPASAPHSQPTAPCPLAPPPPCPPSSAGAPHS
ncbi:complement factor B-like [Terrapene carolina triunguis]|uniref:complement factor B-like n=1 Tax=Terrapene triunguis TaxID=2587831 RepID=UPI00115643E2|nr:complement factor B-like [Terrapene carolina triunguis]